MEVHNEAQELKNMESNGGVGSKDAISDVQQIRDNRDRDELARLGKKSVLKV